MSTPHSPGGREQRERDRLRDDRDREGALRLRGGRADAPVLDDAVEVGRLDGDGEGLLVARGGERLRVRRAVLAERHLHDLEPQVAEVGPHRLAVLGVDPGREHRARAAAREPLGHQQRLDERGGALVERRVGDFQPGQQADVRLELEDRLQRPLRDLGLVRRVRRQPLGPVEHLVGDRRDVVVVEPGAQEERRVAGVGVLRRHPADEAADLDLGHRRRQVRRAAHGLRDRGKEVVDRLDADRREHRRALGVGGREELHFSCSSSRTYSAYASADISLPISTSVETFSLMSQPSPNGSSLMIPGSPTALLLTATTSPEIGV